MNKRKKYINWPLKRILESKIMACGSIGVSFDNGDGILYKDIIRNKKHEKKVDVKLAHLRIAETKEAVWAAMESVKRWMNQIQEDTKITGEHNK